MSGQAKMIFNMYGGGVPGVRAFYSGLTASMGRQLTYSATRFAVYDYLKSVITKDKRNLTGIEKMGIAMSAGAIGGVFGTPCDLVNVRMQSDSKLKIGDVNRRNYGNVVKGLNHIYKTEGTKVLMNGWEMATIRASFMTLGQIAMYEVFKETAVSKLNMPDVTPTHLFCSAMAGVCGAAFTMPFDVMKTRMMNTWKVFQPVSLLQSDLITRRSNDILFRIRPSCSQDHPTNRVDVGFQRTAEVELWILSGKIKTTNAIDDLNMTLQSTLKSSHQKRAELNNHYFNLLRNL